MAIQAVVEIPVLFGFSRLLKKFQPKTLMIFAAAGYVLKAAAYAAAPNIVSIYAVQLTQTVSFAIFASASVYYVMATVADEDQLTGQAVMTATMAAGNVIGSLTGGWIINVSGITCMLRVNIAAAAAGLALALLSGGMLQKTVGRTGNSH